MPYAVFGEGHGENRRGLITHSLPVLFLSLNDQEARYGTS